MAKTIIALHDDPIAAQQSMQELIDNEFQVGNISFVTPHSEVVSLPVQPEWAENNIFLQSLPVAAPLFGSTDFEVMNVAGIGLVQVGGPLAAELNIQASRKFSGVGRSLSGGLLGALISMGVPEERAHYYAEGVRQGSTLILVKAPDYRAAEAVAIINHNQPVDLKRRVNEWRKSGWNGFAAPSAA